MEGIKNAQEVAPDFGTLKAQLEAILYISGDPIQKEKVALLLDVPEEELQTILDDWASKLEKNDNTAFCLVQTEAKVGLSIKKNYQEMGAQFFSDTQPTSLSQAAYETLAAVLYNQPTTKAEVESVRGVNSDYQMNRLEERGLIEACGVLEQPGRPTLFRVTENCLMMAGLRSEADLPALDLIRYDGITALSEPKITDSDKEPQTQNQDESEAQSL